MSPEKVREVIALYRRELRVAGVGQGQFPHQKLVEPGCEFGVLEHCAGMLDQMEEFVQQGRMEKAFRWLGFLQGCLWSVGVYTIEEMKNHNRPPE